MKWAKDTRAHLQSMRRDTSSLSDHATYLANKVTFLLEAMLGVVNLEQNAIIKIFSIAAVIFMPPTLVASIYGMNFHHNMIELDWQYGYPLRADRDRARRRAADRVFQVEEVVVRLQPKQCMFFCTLFPLVQR